MACVGSGQQRYKFMSHQLDRGQTQGRSALQPDVSSGRVVFVGRPAQLSSTDTDLIAASFVGALHVTDVRYALVYYGPFFRDIPRRLGSSPVLDSAVKAISAAYPFLHTGCYSPTALARYGQSLRALRECLNDAAEARTPNTLCAVYLITICQVSMFACSYRTPLTQELITMDIIRAGWGNMTTRSQVTVKPFLIFSKLLHCMNGTADLRPRWF